MENTGFLGVTRHISYVSFFLKFLQINNIPYLLAAPKKSIFSLKFLCASHLKIKHFEFPYCPILAIGCCWLSVILQISNFEAILYLGHFFYTPCSIIYSQKNIVMFS